MHVYHMAYTLYPLKLSKFAPLGAFQNIYSPSKAMSSLHKSDSVGYCMNIKSKKQPDTRCPNRATQGEYCGLHVKHPLRYIAKTPDSELHSSFLLRSRTAAIIQNAWRQHAPYIRYKNQGPAVNDPSLSTIDSDIYTFDPISNTPIVYRWSYADCHKNIWLFDIRSLCMMYEKDPVQTFLNPYTRDPIPKEALASFYNRCTQLRAHKYILAHTEKYELTPDQLWQQRILDVILHMDGLGYHTCVHWFEELSIQKLSDFYGIMYQIWNTSRLTPIQVRREILPNQEKPIFQKSSSFYKSHTEKRWWQKFLLDTIETLLISGESKSAQTQGAMFVIRAYAFVSLDVRASYHWILS